MSFKMADTVVNKSMCNLDFHQNFADNAIFSRISLPSIALNDKKLRFLSLLPENKVETKNFFKECICNGIPLFLGCDVLAGCSQAPSNHARIHARYSKLGLTTKLILKDFRIDGVKKGSVLWFYNIEGVFRVTFECHERAVQKAVMTKLMGLWLKRYTDKPLQEIYNVTLCRDSLVNSDVTSLQCHNVDDSFCVQRETTLENCTNQLLQEVDNVAICKNSLVNSDVTSLDCDNSDYIGCDQGETNMESTVSYKCDKTSVPNSENTDRTTLSKSKTSDSYSHVNKEISESISQNKLDRIDSYLNKSLCNTSLMIKSKVDVSTQTEEDNSRKMIILQLIKPESSKTDHKLDNSGSIDGTKEKKPIYTDHLRNDYVKSNSETHLHNNLEICAEGSIATNENLDYDAYLKKLISEIKTFVNKFSVERENEMLVLKTMLTLLKFERKQKMDIVNGFPFELIDLYLNDIHKGERLASEDEITPRDVFLSTVSKWLGKQYNLFQNYISAKVAKFKTDYITCIDDLPHSEMIVNIIFPKCMQELLKCWMGYEEVYTNISSSNTDYYNFVDHNYIPAVKRNKQEVDISNHGNIPYPLIQLILEFANKALVSGVAHVVYSKICHAI